MERLIKVDGHNRIIDLFFRWQKEKYATYDYYLDDHAYEGLKINGKSISDEYGNPIFIYIGDRAQEIPIETRESDPDFIAKYKKIKKEELQNILKNEWLDVTRTQEEIKTRWQTFKQNASSWTTKDEIDTAFNQAVTWLRS